MYRNNSSVKPRTIVSLKDIARETGFSIMTISRTLRGLNRVAEVTRTTILNKAKELGYCCPVCKKFKGLPIFIKTQDINTKVCSVKCLIKLVKKL